MIAAAAEEDDWATALPAVDGALAASHQPQPRHLHHPQCSAAAVATHQPKQASCGVSSSCSDVHGLRAEPKDTLLLLTAQIAVHSTSVVVADDERILCATTTSADAQTAGALQAYLQLGARE